LSRPNCRQIAASADVAEQVRQIADRHRRAERARAAVAAMQIADQRFAADEKLVGITYQGPIRIRPA